MPTKVVVCGAGFIGSNIARAVAASKVGHPQVQLSSRSPNKLHEKIKHTIPEDRLLPPAALDITEPSTLPPAFKDADVVVSLVGIMHGSPKAFEEIQFKGTENVAKAAKEAGAKLIQFSAIGVDKNSDIPYAKTKAMAEESVRRICPDVTIIRPSIVFGPEDDFFNRFSVMSKFLPFLPVFGGGTTKFQPVFVGDLARAVEICSRDNSSIRKEVNGKIIEAGGPETFTFKELMQLVLKYNHRTRPILSVPYAVGMLQGVILEQLPQNMFTVTRSQVKQLKVDSVINPSPPSDYVLFKDLLEKYSGPLTSVHDQLPTYL